MSLESVSISDEGPIEQVSCDRFPSLMVIAGPNGVGKSTLLRHIFDMSDSEFNNETHRVYFGPHRSPESSSVTEQNLLDMNQASAREVLSYSQNRTSGYAEGVIESILGTRNTGGSGSLNRSDVATSPDTLPYYEVKRRIFQLHSQMGNELVEEYTTHDHVARGFWPDISEPFKKAVNDILSGVKFDGIELENHEYSLSFTNRDGSSVTFDDLSSGEKDAIALSFLAIEHNIEQELVNRDLIEGTNEDLVVLIDGPESYLHPRLQLNYIDYMRRFIASYPDERDIQIIMCTHSNVLLNDASDQELHYMMYPDSVDGNQLKSANTLPTDEFDEITKQLGTVSISSGKSLLLVEGPRDRDILRIMYTSLEADIDVLPMFGKDAVLSRTLNELVPELAEVGVRVYGIVDRDRDLELEDSVRQRIHVLPATCMENLLLKPEPLYEALVERAGITAVENIGINDPTDTDAFIQDIVDDPAFVEQELRTRWNEEFNPTNIRLSQFRQSQESNMGDYTKSIVNKKLDRSRSIDQHEQVIEYLINSKKYSLLNGKEIMFRISNTVNEDQDSLCREVARQMRSMDISLSEGTSDFVENMLSDAQI